MLFGRVFRSPDTDELRELTFFLGSFHATGIVMAVLGYMLVLHKKILIRIGAGEADSGRTKELSSKGVVRL